MKIKISLNLILYIQENKNILSRHTLLRLYVSKWDLNSYTMVHLLQTSWIIATYLYDVIKKYNIAMINDSKIFNR